MKLYLFFAWVAFAACATVPSPSSEKMDTVLDLSRTVAQLEATKVEEQDGTTEIITATSSCVAYKKEYVADQNSYYYYFLTTNHSVEDSADIDINLYSFRGVNTDVVSFTIDHVDVVANNDDYDVAVVRALYSGHIPLVKLETAEVRSGTPLVAIGFPLSMPMVITQGYAGHWSSEHKRWVCSAATNLGGSGGGVFHRETNKLIGITTAVCFRYYKVKQGIGYVSIPEPTMHYFTPLSLVKEIL